MASLAEILAAQRAAKKAQAAPAPAPVQAAPAPAPAPIEQEAAPVETAPPETQFDPAIASTLQSTAQATPELAAVKAIYGPDAAPADIEVLEFFKQNPSLSPLRAAGLTGAPNELSILRQTYAKLSGVAEDPHTVAEAYAPQRREVAAKVRGAYEDAQVRDPNRGLISNVLHGSTDYPDYYRELYDKVPPVPDEFEPGWPTGTPEDYGYQRLGGEGGHIDQWLRGEPRTVEDVKDELLALPRYPSYGRSSPYRPEVDPEDPTSWKPHFSPEAVQAKAAEKLDALNRSRRQALEAERDILQEEESKRAAARGLQ